MEFSSSSILTIAAIVLLIVVLLVAWQTQARASPPASSLVVVTPPSQTVIPPPPSISTTPENVFSVKPPFVYATVDGIGNAWALFDDNYDLESSFPENLETFTMDGLAYTPSLRFMDLDQLESIVVTNTVQIGELTLENLTNTPLTAFEFPDFKIAYEEVTILDVNFSTPLLEFPSLEYVGHGGLNVESILGIEEVSLPSLKEVKGGFTINVEGMTSLDLSSLERAAILSTGNKFTIASDSTLTTLTLPNLKEVKSDSIDFFDNAFDQATVDSILATFASLDGTNGTVIWENSSIDLEGSNAAPSAAGLASISILNGRGNTVYVN